EGGTPFSDWDAVQDTALPDESDVERLERLLAQYEGKRTDLLWETTRAFARACHILTEYTDAYANERYLRTATQWENLRRMVEMLDYHPAPPSSASTLLVLETEKDEAGAVEQGFQVKYSPPDGGAPVVFETLEDIEVDPDLNGLQMAGGARAEGSFTDNAEADEDTNAMALWVATEEMKDLSAGQIVVLENGAKEAVVDDIASFSEETRVVTLSGNDWHGYPKADARLLLKAKAVRTPRLNGASVVVFEDGHDLALDDVIAWKDESVWTFNEVEASDAWSVMLKDAGTLPPAAATIYRMVPIDKGSTHLAVPETFRVAAWHDGTSFTSSGFAWNHVTSLVDVNDDDLVYTSTGYKVLESPNIDTVFIVPYGIASSGKTASDSSIQFTWFFPGGAGGLTSGQWVAVKDTDGGLYALQLAEVVEQEDHFTLDFAEASAIDGKSLSTLYGPFRYELSPQGFDRNEKTLNEVGALASLQLEPGESGSLSGLLIAGRHLLIEQKTDNGFEHAVEATVEKVNDGNVIDIKPALDAEAGFTLANTVIRGNVVAAGHGEKQPERVLGSGTADQINQEFVFTNKDVSFVSDSTMDSGVRADIDVKVDGRIWELVSTLNDSRPTDAHYTIRMTEEGHIRIAFGDGEHGRRLPNGSNNVRINWRKGTGLAGYVDAGGLVEPIKPHRLIASLRQPMPTGGSGDMEDATSLRENAPSSLLTFERAVSIADFIHLAASRSSVAQANAFASTSLYARHDSVEVVVVPADGSTLGDDLQEELQSWLADHSLPGIEVNVSGFESVTLGLDVMLRVKSSEFDPEIVTADVKAALLASFALLNRRLGQALYRAELYAVIEAVQGVENSTCLINAVNEAEGVTASPLIVRGSDGETIKTIKATQRQVIYLAADGLAIDVAHEEFAL
ncbi:MAG: hypothetical protein Q9M23_08575, partial [Mariprofundaceae bacterium]|nr:hypothetical protein [Mariprofundaceae bacterium]